MLFPLKLRLILQREVAQCASEEQQNENVELVVHDGRLDASVLSPCDVNLADAAKIEHYAVEDEERFQRFQPPYMQVISVYSAKKGDAEAQKLNIVQSFIVFTHR